MLDVLKEIENEIDFRFPNGTEFVKSDSFAVYENKVCYRNGADIFRAALRVKSGIVGDKKYTEPDRFDDLCFFVDCTRNAVPTVGTVKKIIRIAALLGYNAVMLYMENTFETNNEPVFGYMCGRYTKAELKEMDSYAVKVGMELIPAVQTLAHFERLKRWYKEYDEHFDCGDILMPDDKRVETLLENIFDTLSECFTSRRVHIGMDEAHMLGRGRYYDVHGARPMFDLFMSHLNKVASMAERRGLSCIMWGDMFCGTAKSKSGESNASPRISTDVTARMPKNTEVSHWCYEAGGDRYLERYELYKAFGKPTWMALSVHKCLDFLPMNRYAEHEYDAAFDALAKFPFMRRLINCAWSDNGGECSVFASLPAMTAFICKAYGLPHAVGDRLFYALTDIEYDDFCKIEYANTLCDAVTEDYASPSKMFLYNDVLCGQFDCEVMPEYRNAFQAAKEENEKLAKSKYGILFENAAAYADVLIRKFDMGLRVRKAYSDGDKIELKRVADEIPSVVAAIDEFLGTLRKRWFFENKPQGFEIQELRLGGVKERLSGVRKRLVDYACGKVSSIPELDEPILPDIYLGRNEKTGRLQWSSFALTVSVNGIS